MQAPRNETGVRLILVSLAAALLAAVIAPLLYLSVASALASDSASAYWWHTVVMPGISLSVMVACGVAGVAGIMVVEWNRGRSVGQDGQRWDRIRVAAVLSIVSGASVLFLGIFVGFVYVALYSLIFFSRFAAGILLAISVGLFLLWTAERIGATTNQLPRIAFLSGAIAAGVPTATMAASLLRLMPSDLVIAGAVWALATSMGMLSLGAWIIVYARILARSHSPDRSVAVSV